MFAIWAAIVWSAGAQMVAEQKPQQQVATMQPFWIAANIESIEWREGCLTTALCSQPRFQILKDLLPTSERLSVNWPISEHFVKDTVKPFVSYWSGGKPEDVSMSAQVVGIDRTYGFPRVCDQSPSVRVFETSRNASDEQTLKVSGKCFNATLVLTKHADRCPWCPDPRELTIIGQHDKTAIGGEADASRHIWFKDAASDERVVYVGILLLAVIAVTASTAFALVLVAFTRYKRKCATKSCRFHPYMTVKARDDDATANRYDLPWEQQQRPLAYWMTSSHKSSGGESTITSPLDSASSIPNNGNDYYQSAYHTYRPPPPPFPPPPQTHIRARTNDDSGMESI